MEYYSAIMKNKRNPVICNKLDGTRDRYVVKGSKPDTNTACCLSYVEVEKGNLNIECDTKG